MTELLDDPLYTLDSCAASAPWRADDISALRRRLRTAGLPYRVVIDHGRNVHATLVDTFDWRLLGSGRIALLIEGANGEDGAGLAAGQAPAHGSGPAAGHTEAEDAPNLNILYYTYRQVRRDRCEEERTAGEHPAAGPADELAVAKAGADVSTPAPTLIAPSPEVNGSFKNLSDIVAPRALLQMGAGTLTFRRGRLVNGAGKTEAILDEIAVDGIANTDGTGDTTGSGHVKRFLLVRPLRGYRRIASIPLGATVGVDGVVDALATSAGRRPFDFDTRLNLPIQGGDDPQAAHRHVVSRLVGTMAAVRPGIGRVRDPEFLHDYRVALRRLRSYLKESGLGPPPPAQTRPGAALLDEIWDATGAARDFDVFLERRDHYLYAAPAPLRDEVTHLFERIADMREASYTTLLARLPLGYEADLEDELLARGPGWGSVGAQSSADGARLDAQATRWVRRREKKFLKLVSRLQEAYAAVGTELDDERIHAARKAAKKYRYLHEIFLPVLDDRTHTSKRVKRLRKLQNLLGSYNDLVVEEARFHEILTRRDTVSYGDVRAATAYMLAQVEREKETARERVLKELSREVQ